MPEHDFSMVAEDLKAWLPKVLYKHTEDDTLGRCKRFILRQLSAQGRDTADVHAVKLAEDDYSAPNAVEYIATELAEAAQRDADGLGHGVQRYCLYAYFEKSPHTPAFRRAFMVAGSGPLDDTEAGFTEKPTAEGIITQLMRHNEINQKNSMVAMGFLFANQQKQSERLLDAIEASDRRHFDLMVLLEEVISTKHEREMQMEEVRASRDTKKKIGEKLDVLFPVVFNRIAKREVFPEKSSPTAMLAGAFFESLTPKQQELFRESLSPEQLTAMIEVVQSVQKSKEGDEKASKKLSEMAKEKILANAQRKLGAAAPVVGGKPPTDIKPLITKKD